MIEKVRYLLRKNKLLRYVLVQVVYSIGIGAVMKRWGEDSEWVSKGVMGGVRE